MHAGMKGGGPGNVASPHWPVIAFGESITMSPFTGIFDGGTG